MELTYPVPSPQDMEQMLEGVGYLRGSSNVYPKIADNGTFAMGLSPVAFFVGYGEFIVYLRLRVQPKQRDRLLVVMQEHKMFLKKLGTDYGSTVYGLTFKLKKGDKLAGLIDELFADKTVESLFNSIKEHIQGVEIDRETFGAIYESTMGEYLEKDHLHTETRPLQDTVLNINISR